MVEHNQVLELLHALDQILVTQFRELQSLVELTRKEREALLGDADTLMAMVEDKEALLDQLGLIEDKRRKIVQDLLVGLNISSEATSIAALLPHLKDGQRGRIEHLSEGINALASQAREVNHANQALAFTRIDYIQAAQAFLIGAAQPESSYRPPAGCVAVQQPALYGCDYRA